VAEVNPNELSHNELVDHLRALADAEWKIPVSKSVAAMRAAADVIEAALEDRDRNWEPR
jgi:hypothetical protein